MKSSKKKTGIYVNTIQCPNCKDIIYSRARYDCGGCSCGDIFIDGGFDYIQLCAKNPAKIKVKKKLLKGVTRKILYDDWNKRTDKYGVIHKKEDK